jgi:hypothetical protein
MNEDYNQPLGRIETVKLLIAAAEEHGMPWPNRIETDERGGTADNIPVVSLSFESSEQMQPWLEYFRVEPGWRREQVIDDRVRLFNATAFAWNGWHQVQLTATDPIDKAVAS